ncbi:sulfotransferase [Sphingomonas psychrotolerans]|uniref:Sulfotransferase n=1 Tax=Sphingomonas psychrotolerans TaxID=1327635 RepID=A0ABU3N1Q7_9SPHN|nr:sulfotransferase [Sphingomonas psychrotolerans]MDT8758318.1 sulfotransferase [Sphingomonas psychrotolerans]
MTFPPDNPLLREAAAALGRGDLGTAERAVRTVLRQDADNVVALMMLADIASAVGIYPEAEAQLRKAVKLAPDYIEAWVNLALVLLQQRRIDDGLALLDRAIGRDPGHVRAAASKANILAQLGDYDAAATVWEALLAAIGDNAEVWMGYGNLLKTLGRQDEAVTAYRRATGIVPDLAEAWWSLAELKAGRITDADVATMEHALSSAPDPSRRLFLHFALGKAFEDRRDWARSFEHYAAGNRLRLALEPHDRSLVSAEVDRAIRVYDGAFFAARRGWGAPAADPIFILGLPRAGSTLVEQILASHPQVEGTAELPYIPQLVQALVAERWRDRAAAHPEIVTSLDAATTTALGHRYLEIAARHRKTDAPFFVDKLPNNWLYAGFIHLILPNARIIDARREPMACCFSNFKQHFARGQTFAYSFEDLGAYYRDNVRLMAHLEGAMPGVIHRVQHEALLADPEAEIRRLLDFLGLPFDPRCLAPHENRRPVRTASSEQVRRPINRDAMDLWRHYEPWLGGLKTALGPLAPQ